MTGPAIPSFTPDVKPAWSFQGPGDVGAVGNELHGLADAFSKMQALQQAQEAQKMEHDMSMQALALRQQEAANSAEEIKIRQIAARDQAKENEHRRKKEAGEIQSKTQAGAANKDAQVMKNVAGVADAGAPVGETDAAGNPGTGEAGQTAPDFFEILTALLGQDLQGGPDQGTPDIEMADQMKTNKAQGLGQPASRSEDLASPDAILRAQVDREQMAATARLQAQQDAAAMARLEAQQKAALEKSNAAGGGKSSAIMRQKQVEYRSSLAIMVPAAQQLKTLKNVDVSTMAGFQRAAATGHKFFMAQAVNALQPGEQQLLMIASDQFASQWLRFVSGLAATDAERLNVIQQVAPMYGDTPEVKVYKSSMRQMMIGAVSAAATGERGNADAVSILNEYNNVFEKETMIEPNDSPQLIKAKNNMRALWGTSKSLADEKLRRPEPATTEIAVPENVDADAAAVAGQNWTPRK